MQHSLATQEAPAAHGHLQARRSIGSAFSDVEAGRLNVELERRMAAARPRLMRLPRSHGLSPDTAEDVVQGTRLAAWRHLDRLYEPDAFHPWLPPISPNPSRPHPPT